MLSYNFNDLFTYGGITFIILIGCSILSLKVIIEKWISLSLYNENSIEATSKEIKYALKSNDLKEAIHLVKASKEKKFGLVVQNPAASIIKFLLNHIYLQREELFDLTFAEMDKELVRAEKGLGILATLGNISPFIGLFGTVLGIIKSFHGLSVNEASSYMTVMGGIAEALISTAAGLIVAVPSVIFYNHYIKRIKRSVPTLEKEVKEIVYMLKKESSIEKI
jgi:biopolymer transport protein ExbB/TolQ